MPPFDPRALPRRLFDAAIAAGARWSRRHTRCPMPPATGPRDACCRRCRACHPARVVNLLLSDVPGDAAIDSGEGESMKPGDPRLPDLTTHLVATPIKSETEKFAKLVKDARVTIE